MLICALLMIWLHHIASLADCASGWCNARRLVTGKIQLCHSLQRVLELAWREFPSDGFRVLTRYYRLTCTFSPHREAYITNVCVTVIRKRLHNTKRVRISSRRENLSICSAQYYCIQQGFVTFSSVTISKIVTETVVFGDINISRLLILNHIFQPC